MVADFCTSKTRVAKDEMKADGGHLNDSPERKEIQDRGKYKSFIPSPLVGEGQGEG